MTQQSQAFVDSLLKASGLPNAREKQYLTQLQQKYKGDVPTDIFEKPMGWLQQEINIRSRLKLATKILKEAGYRVKNKALFNSKGKKVAFNFLLSGPGFSRIVEPFIKNLRRLGIESKTKILEQSVYLRSLQNRQFDITVLSVGQSQSPGNEQKDFWHSSTAQTPYSRNHYGLTNKAIDDVVDQVIYAKTRDDLEFYTRCLDRLLYHQHIAVHHWHIKSHRVAYWDKFSFPKNMPLFYNPTQLIDLMWLDPTKNDRLSQAIAKEKTL